MSYLSKTNFPVTTPLKDSTPPNPYHCPQQPLTANTSGQWGMLTAPTLHKSYADSCCREFLGSVAMLRLEDSISYSSPSS